MAIVTIPYSFSPNTQILSAQVNANFNVLAGYLNSGGMSDVFNASGRITLPGGVQMCWGSQDVPVDGEPTFVTFAEPFSTQCWTVVVSADNPYASNPWALSASSNSPALNGFTGTLAGGPGGGAVALIRYIAIGN
jgi:hypothetical protein